MFTQPTVFVLGAGVSVPHGFPSGVGLINAICNKPTVEEKNLVKILCLANPDRSESFILDFIRHLEGSGLYSIDTWLEGNREFMTLGKTAIAALIWEAEHRAVVARIADSDNWFRWLWSKMYTPEIHQLAANQIYFVTFNYDRFLEFKLHNCIRHSYVQEREDIQLAVFEALKAKIIHVHGELKAASLESYGNIGRTIYKGDSRITNPSLASQHAEIAEHIQVLAKGINVVCESSQDKAIEKAASGVFEQCEKRIFLGFSYDKRNVQRLKIQPIVNKLSAARGSEAEIVSYEVVGSAFGLELAEQLAIKSQFSGRIHFGENTLNAVGFCRKYVLVP